MNPLPIRAILPLLLAAAGLAGCHTHATLTNVVAEQGVAQDILVRFKSDVDFLRWAEFHNAYLGHPASEQPHENEGPPQVGIQASRIALLGTPEQTGFQAYYFVAVFPAKGEGLSWNENRAGKKTPFDLTLPGTYPLEFFVNGGTCFGPGSYDSNVAIIQYRVP